MAEVQGMLAASDCDSKQGKRTCSKSAIGDEGMLACGSGSKKGRTETSPPDLQSENDIEIVGDEYEEEEEVRFFTEEEQAQFLENLKIFWAETHKTSRYQEKYIECIERSQGFDLPSSDIEESLSEGDLPMGQIKKCGASEFGDDGDVGQAAIWGLQEHNKLRNTNLELVKVVKANATLVSGIIYYITLVAQDNVTCEQNTYRAKVYEPFAGNSELMLFELAPSPSVVDA